MEHSDFAEQILFCQRVADKHPSPVKVENESPGSSQVPGGPARSPRVFVFNPFAEGQIAYGTAFTPVKQQVLLAEDLANLPQFLCEADDIVLLDKRPSAAFLNVLAQAGFPPPEFIETKAGRILAVETLSARKIDNFRPWAWAPDSLKLLEPLFAGVASKARTANQCFNDNIARLYSKAWSAGFLRKALQSLREATAADASWLCSEQEAGIVVASMEDALEAISAIRCRGDHRVVVKQAYGLAGHNAIRLWEPEILPAQRRWLARALEGGRQLVVEPWLERELDFSIQLEMAPRGLSLCGYTGLFNDRKGQFLANWAEADYAGCLPAKVAAFLRRQQDISSGLQRFCSQLFACLEAELHKASFGGPISIDAFVYRTPHGDCRLKPVVEINPRYTMGRVLVELMKHTCAGSCGLLRLVSQAQARREGFSDLSAYARSFRERFPLRLEGERAPQIREGFLCLNDPGQAQVCLATFEVGAGMLSRSGLLPGKEGQGFP